MSSMNCTFLDPSLFSNISLEYTRAFVLCSGDNLRDRGKYSAGHIAAGAFDAWFDG